MVTKFKKLLSRHDCPSTVFTLNPLEGLRPKTFASHRDAVLAAYFSVDDIIYSQQGWRWKAKDASDDENPDKEGPIASSSKGVENDIVNRIANTHWEVHKRHYFNQPSTNLKLSPPHSTLLQIFSLSVSLQASLGCGKCQNFQISTP